MAARLGRALYWIACAIAALLALGGAALFLLGEGADRNIVSIAALVSAALVYALGCLIRYVLAGGQDEMKEGDK